MLTRTIGGCQTLEEAHLCLNDMNEFVNIKEAVSKTRWPFYRNKALLSPSCNLEMANISFCELLYARFYPLLNSKQQLKILPQILSCWYFLSTSNLKLSQVCLII
jgi:hypothetical protein